MRSQGANNRPTCSWVEVQDVDGRTRMEARWTVTPVTPVAAPHAA